MQAIFEPIRRIPGGAAYKFLQSVIGREINHGAMDDDVKNYHLHPLDQSLPAVEFLSQRQRGKFFHRREPLAVLVDK